ncbi:non-homologous end-joining DNA ligase [Conexibacter sp. SYSU D00693]|uniref:non-homologous end-joining DNA ligase n=1 Tax=Conexibacter sp. SYSU D00693 TaxID=2812560 RepID=UPI00196A4E49|nr:non-homologous end-joining DNA ligase [Conexibacter sp. SYSU D00693]
MSRLTSPEKVLWPATERTPAVTKADYAAYLDHVAAAMLPHVRDRAVSLQRFHGGLGSSGFFQKDAAKTAPAWLRTVTVGKRGGGEVHHPLLQDRRSLQWVAQVNALTVHVAPVRRDRLDRPDRLTIDLDPSSEDFEEVRVAALALGERLRGHGLVPHAMVTGSRGVHVVCPLRRTRTATEVNAFAAAVAAEEVARDPDHLTTAFHKDERGSRIYVDVARNAPAQTTVAPYSPRARAGGPVAVPLRWEELEDPGLRPDGWTQRAVLERLDALGGDPWAAIRRSARGCPAPPA